MIAACYGTNYRNLSKTTEHALLANTGATSSGEFLDRNDLTLDNGAVPSTGQDALMTSVGKAARAAGKPSVGVVVTPGSLRTPWSQHLDAVLLAFVRRARTAVSHRRTH